MATCFDDPKLVFSEAVCIISVSKNLTGELSPPKQREQVCEQQHCKTLHTLCKLEATLRTNRPCDSERARILDGRFLVRDLATAYDTNLKHRGVHAGDFIWTGHGIELSGRMSGITNAGILRARIFEPACEKCLEPLVMIGRICGHVTKASDPHLARASIVAVYRFQLEAPPEPEKPVKFKGTLEGALVPPC
jgi:hypothetical protein